VVERYEAHKSGLWSLVIAPMFASVVILGLYAAVVVKPERTLALYYTQIEHQQTQIDELRDNLKGANK